MKTFNKSIRSKSSRVKLFWDKSSTNLENSVNVWLSENDCEVISMEFINPTSENDSYKRMVIIYRFE
jgi:hypothetical protein